MPVASMPNRFRDSLWYGLTIGLAVAAVLLTQGMSDPGNYRGGLALLAFLLLLPVGLITFFQRPEVGVYLLLILVSFGSEYSQTEWGVRSADDLATIYNRRVLPGLIASPFDLLFAATLALWLGRKWLRREGFAWLPGPVWLPLLLALAFTVYATLLGLSKLPQGYDLYYILREVRPFLYLFALLLMTIDVVTTRNKVISLWWLIVLLALIRGIQGVIRHYLGIGRWYYGTTMVYYDYSDTILLLAGMAFLFTWLLGQPRLKLGMMTLLAVAAAPMLYAFIFSFRRSFWIGTATSLALLFIYAGKRERRRYLILASLAAPAVAGVAILALGAEPFALVGQRVRSITDAQNDPSNYFRVLDTENALNAVYESAGLGLGFGSRYQVVASVPWLAEFIRHVSRASHNGYLYLAMKMGLLGLFSWTWFWLAKLWVCFGLLRRVGGRFRFIGSAVSLVLIACAIANLFLPLYYNLRPLLLLAVFGGLALAAWQIEQSDQAKS